MELTASLIKRVTVGSILAFVCLAAPLSAVVPPTPGNPAPPAQVQTDPFVKKDAVVPVEETGPVSNLILTIEVYHLSQADGARLIQENEEDQARHDHLLDLVKEGKASLDTVLCGAAKPGQQTTVQQSTILDYAVAFDPSQWKGIQGSDFKTREIGDRLVFKTSANPDGQSCTIAMFLENTRLRGFTDQDSGLNGPKGPLIASLPSFDVQRTNNAPTYFPYEKIRFLGTYIHPPPASPTSKPPGKPGEGPEMSLLFGKVSRMQLAPGALANGRPAHLEHQLSLYSMDRDKALLVLSRKQEPDSAYQAVQLLVKSNDAKLERLSVLRTDSGVKSNYDEATEIPYPIGRANTTVQDVGFSEELRPDFPGHAQFLTIDLTKCQILSYLGNFRGEGIAGALNKDQPVFGNQSLVTTIHSALGEHELLGTFSPGENTGIAAPTESGKVWLAFLRTTAVNP